jgi:hypothetical protein
VVRVLLGGLAAAGLVALGGIFFVGSAGPAYAPDADPDLVQAAALPAAERRCQACGWIESHREMDSKDGAAGALQYTVRMHDGSSRVFEEATGVKWRLGERLIYIN